jgi:hypothetical protein
MEPSLSLETVVSATDGGTSKPFVGLFAIEGADAVVVLDLISYFDSGGFV